LRCSSVTCPPARPPARPRTCKRCESLLSLLLVPIASFQALREGGGIHSSFETFQRQNFATFEVSFRSFLFPFSCSLLRLNSSSPLSKHLELLSSTLTKVYENQKCLCGSWWSIDDAFLLLFCGQVLPFLRSSGTSILMKSQSIGRVLSAISVASVVSESILVISLTREWSRQQQWEIDASFPLNERKENNFSWWVRKWENEVYRRICTRCE
jgi:hypothetical protein